MLGGEPEEALLEAARVGGPATLRTLAELADLDMDQALELARQLIEAGRLKELRGETDGTTIDSLVVAVETWQANSRRAASMLG